ncbi:Agmatine deiminase [Cladobotryum mycophilum]|uniref:Agmatine deiminase n=1 Tax=Cladobotryum mycophilum TaxID=491253 RepID=A0ABR0T0V3_9HYPO
MTPGGAVLRRPAEWLHHARTILAWPSKAGYMSRYPDSIHRATNDVSSIASAVAHFEPVTLLVDHQRYAAAEHWLRFASTPYQIQIHPVPGQLDLWMRDIAPVYVLRHGPDGQHSVCGDDFNFNGWGNKYLTPTTDKLARHLLQGTYTERVESSIVIEGGAIEIDGEGTLVATESSLINDNRNPGKTRQDIEAELRRTLGVEKFIWIPGRKGLEVTDCHIDSLVRFVKPGLVLLSKPNKMDKSEWTDIYTEARDILANSTDARGRQLSMVDILEADLYSIGLDRLTLQALETGEEEPAALSYVNYHLVNGGIILPQFGDSETDFKALQIFRELFVDRKVVPVPIKELPLFGGGIHCATQEVPLA